jgi:microcystin-dependent protein
MKKATSTHSPKSSIDKVAWWTFLFACIGLASRSVVAEAQHPSLVPPGVVVASAATITRGHEPFGWLLCDGRTVNKKQFPDLFAVLQYRYGGAGDDFGLPNYQGRFLRGVDPERMLDPGPRTSAAHGGIDEVGSTEGDATRRHRHHENVTNGSHPCPAGSEGHFEQINVCPPRMNSDTSDNDDQHAGDETRPANTSVFYRIRARR